VLSTSGLPVRAAALVHALHLCAPALSLDVSDCLAAQACPKRRVQAKACPLRPPESGKLNMLKGKPRKLAKIHSVSIGVGENIGSGS